MAIQSIAREIAAANPGRKWKPGELLDAVNDALQGMDKVDPIAKQIAQLQLQYYKANLSSDTSRANTEDRTSTTQRGQDIRAEDQQKAIDERWKAVQLQTSTQAKIAAARDATQMQAAELRSATQEDINSKVIQFRTQALEAGLDEKTWHDQLAAALKEEGMNDAFITKVFASQASNATPGGAPPPPKKTASSLPPPPKRGAVSDAPPPAALKKGVHTTFANGQTWTLGPDGKPVRVK